nr:glutathione binding-like protein [Providencia sp. G1(2023)]
MLYIITFTDYLLKTDVVFNPALTPEEYKDTARGILFNKFKYVDNVLSKQAFFAGDSFSVADAYLFTVSGWAKHVGLDLASLTHLQDYMAKIAKRPNVQDALKAEGLI